MRAERGARELPHVAEILGPLLERVPAGERPLLIAIAERLAAERYRRWAAEPRFAAERSRILACARREEEIAGRVEALHPEAAAIQRDILARNPDLEEVNRSLFAERPLDEQLRIQAQGERVGAQTWRAFAREADGSAREVFEACALLEEENAETLEQLLEAGACG